jgi:hypothetical protein
MNWTHDIIKPKDWNGQAWECRQQKLDGHRLTLFRQKDGMIAFGRDRREHLELGNKHQYIKNLEWWKQAMELPPFSSLDGELYVPGGTCGDVATALANEAPIKFTPFAVPYFDNCCCFENSVMWAQAMCNTLLGMDFPLTITDSRNKDELLAEADKLAIEGWVLKSKNYIGWWKLKRIHTIDCFVTGFKDGKGKFAGQCGALIVSANIDHEIVEVASISGMDDSTRQSISQKDINRVCEVKYQAVGAGSRLVHPRFVRWRDDKPMAECVYRWEDLK